MILAQFPAEKIDSLLRTHYAANAPGAAVAIVRDGKMAFKKCYGVADISSKEKITSHTNFNIGSISKQFTAMAILQLLEKRKLSLQDKLTKFFPGFNSNVGKNVTVQHLLTHSSGIVDHYGYIDPHHLRHATDQDVLNAIQHVDSSYFQPGSQYRYSNTAYCLLTLIVEQLSGLSYPRYMQQYIFEPTGMKETMVWQEDEQTKNRATGYEFDPGTKKFKKSDADENVFFSTRGDGGIYTSLDEYLLWFSALQTAKPFKDSLIKMARSVQFPIRGAKHLGYGYGWFIGDNDGSVTAYHTGSNGGFRSMVFSIPAKNYLLVIFSNRTGIDQEELALEINKILSISSKPFTKIEPFISFQDCWPIFAPCKKTPWYLNSFVRNWNAREMALN